MLPKVLILALVASVLALIPGSDNVDVQPQPITELNSTTTTTTTTSSGSVCSCTCMCSDNVDVQPQPSPELNSTTPSPTITSNITTGTNSSCSSMCLEFSPRSSESNGKSSLIWYNSSERNYSSLTQELDKFLEVYRNPFKQERGSSNIQECSYDFGPTNDMVCHVDIRHLGPCITENNYNYHRSAPCIILKINKALNWEPEYYNDTTALPSNMPEDLRNHISTRKLENPNYINTVWVSCEGENPADVENIGPIQYIPMHGFPGYFFPSANTENYLSPLVALLFERPATGVLINIECKAWAHNIQHDSGQKEGSVHFELFLE